MLSWNLIMPARIQLRSFSFKESESPWFDLIPYACRTQICIDCRKDKSDARSKHATGVMQRVQAWLLSTAGKMRETKKITWWRRPWWISGRKGGRQLRVPSHDVTKEILAAAASKIYTATSCTRCFMVRAGGRGGLGAADTESDGCAGTGLEGARPEVRGIQPHAQRTRVGEAPSDTAGAEGGGETSATTRAGYAERVGDGRTDLGCFRSDGRACRMAEPPPGGG